jgi:ATP-dependent exoDNAse (exonuclease V) beta subunit
MTVLHPTNKAISLTFNEENHSYIDNENNTYISATTLIGDYFEKFDSEKIATKCAIKRGTTKEKLLKEWKDIAEIASKQGTLVHNMLECLFDNEDYCEEKGDVYKKFDKQTRLIHNHIIREKKLIPIYIEQILFDPSTKIAGTVDGVFLYPDKSKYLILDWKTSKTIEKENNYGKYGFDPFEKFCDCNHIHYSIQLMIYSYLLKSQGYLELDIPIDYRIIQIHQDKSKSYEINHDIMMMDMGKVIRERFEN